MKSAGLDPRYEILDELGTGRHTVVLRVHDLGTGQIRALKLLRDPDSERMLAFEAEFLLMRDLDHPSFPEAFDFGRTSDGRACFTMACIESPDLSCLAGRPDAAARLPAVLHDACLALRVLHHRGLLHADVKPANLKLTHGRPGPSVRLLDLGLARPPYRGEARQISGTAPYIAPEILLGGDVDPQADIYALGASVHAALAGRPPFEGTAEEIVRRILSEGLPPVRSVREDLPEGLAGLIDGMTARRAADRPRDVEEVIRRLEALGHPSRPETSAGACLLCPVPDGWDERLRRLLPPRPVRSGEPGVRLRLVSGPVGSGRSALLRALRSRLQVLGYRTLGFTGDRGTAGLPGLRHIAADAGLSPEGAPGAGGTTDVEGIHGVNRLLASALDGRPAAFLVDDVEGAERSSRIAVEHLLRELAPDGPFCFAGVGVEGDGPVPSGGSGRGAVGAPDGGADPVIHDRRREDLAALSREETGRLLEGLLGAVRDREELAADVHRWTAGAPALVREVVRGLVDRGVLRFAGGQWEVDRVELEAYEPPGRIDSIFAARAAGLTEAEAALLRIASIFGDECRVDDLLALEGGAVGNGRGVLERLLEQGGPVRGAGDGRIRFREPPLREYLHAAIEPGERRALHRRALRILEGREDGVDPLAMAVHHREAGQVAEAIRWYRAAIDRAGRGGALLEAYRGLETLAGWARAAGREDFELEAALGEVLFEWHEFSGAAEAFDRAAAILAGEADSAHNLLDLRIRKARCLVQINLLDEALVLLRETGERVGWRAADARTGRIQREIGWIHYRRGRYREALRFYRRCLANARRHGDTMTRLHLCNDIAVVHVERGDWRRAERWIARAVQGGVEEDRPLVVAHAHSIRGWSHRLRAEYDRAEEFHRKALDVYRQIGDSFDMARTYNSLGQLHRERGNLETAVLYLERGLYMAECYPLTINTAHTVTNLGLAKRSLGRLDRSCGLLRRGVDLFLRCGDQGNAAIACGDLLESRLAADRSEAAREALREQRRLSRAAEKPYVRLRLERSKGLVALAEGHPDRAAVRLLETAGGFRSLGHPKDAVRARKDAARALLAAGRAAEAYSEAARALEAARKIGSLELTVESGLAASRALEGLGRMEEASVRLREAIDGIAETPYRRLRAEAMWAGAGFLHRCGAWRRRGVEASRYDACIAEAEALFREMGLTGRWKEVRAMRKEADDSVRKMGGRELFTLYEAGRAINSTLSIEEVLERLMDLVIETMQVERGVVFLRDPVTGELRPAAARNVERETIEDARTFSTTILDAVGGAGRPLYIPDCRDDPACAESESISKYSILSVICVPLRERDEIVGTVYVDDRRTSHPFTPADVDFLVSLGDLAAVALRNARLHEALETASARLREENLDLRRRVRPQAAFHGLIGRHESMDILRQVIEKVARTDASVLIRGENGTGKELVARAVHDEGGRRDRPFVVVNCAAIPESLLEAEIFGIEGGTATGVERRIGKFEQADGGTLFLDEVGDMIPAVQAKFLRVLQERRFERVGGRESIAVDVRILAATNQDLEAAMETGRFREDLFYRLNTIPIFVPPLRERRDDIPRLARHFLQTWGEENDRNPPEIDRAAMEDLILYDWPGNVRQLRNVVERMAVLCEGTVVGADDIPPEIRGSADPGVRPLGLGTMTPVREIARAHVRAVYRACGEQKKRACEVLGITYKTLRAYLDD